MRSYTNPTGLGAVLHHALLAAMTLISTIFLAGEYSPLHAEGLEYGRFRISPKLSVVERYSDNIYLEPNNKENDFFTQITPEIALDFALAPRNYISLKYTGNFFLYGKVHNFDSAHNFGEASWSAKTAKGSSFDAGVSTSTDSVQPFSPTDVSKDYTLNRIFADMNLLAGQVTEFDASYEHRSRRFDKDLFQNDDYDRDEIDVGAIYRRSEIFPLLLQYRFVNQNNSDNPPGFNRDYKTHTVFTGARWLPSGKLSGALRVGYTWSDFNNPQIEQFSGLGMDIDMLYKLSDITQLNLIGQRAIEPSTIAQRDTGSYYVLTSGGLRITYHRWEKIIATLSYFYYHRNYKSNVVSGGARTDQEHVAGLDIEYALQRWVSIILGYQYRKNDSDLESVKYKENLVQLGVRFSI